MRMKQAVEVESNAWGSGLDKPMSPLASTVCSLATDCTPHPAQPALSPTDTPMISCIHTQVPFHPSLHPPHLHPTFMLLFLFFGLPSHQLTLSTAPLLLESFRGTPSAISSETSSLPGYYLRQWLCNRITWRAC